MIVELIIVAAFVPLALFWSVWLAFALLSLLPSRELKARQASGDKPAIDVLIPAHNEELLLPSLLRSLQEQTLAGKQRLGRVLVVADHCADSTAAIARAMGTVVLERLSGPRGKPAALREGLVHLRELHRKTDGRLGAVAILDADCTVSANLVEEMACGLDGGHKVLQCRYVLQALEGSRELSPSVIAFSLKNAVRPRGMARVGVPTQLFGTGMCFHPDLVSKLEFRDHLIEDLALSHELLLTDHPPMFLPKASVCSPMPTDTSAMSVQKLRWEAGQVHTWTTLPSLLIKLLVRLRIRCVLALLDWSAPPLAMALFGWMVLTAIAAVLVFFEFASSWALLVPAYCIATLVLYVSVGVLQLAEPMTLLRLFAAIPRFLFWKATLYVRMVTGRSPKTWQRTPRTSTPEVRP